MINGLTTAGLGLPDYNQALTQHREYIEALRECGLDVLELSADEQTTKALIPAYFPVSRG